jgi:transcriptional regulator with XRE-family HTH domain
VAALVQERRVTDRPRFDGRRQREALTGLQKASGLDATTVARAVNLSYPQYNRYLWGRVPLRTDQIADFAAAYGVPTAELIRALGLLDPAPEETIIELRLSPNEDEMLQQVEGLPDEIREQMLRVFRRSVEIHEQTSSGLVHRN